MLWTSSSYKAYVAEVLVCGMSAIGTSWDLAVEPPTSYRMHVAILDDDSLYRSIITALLSSQSEIVVSGVTTGDELECLLRDRRVDCILLDHNLGFESGFQIRDRLAEHFDHLPPIVLLTGDERQSTAIKAFRVGIDDFLPKRGLSLNALLSSIAGARVRHDAACRHKADLMRLALSAVRDPVTGLATKAMLDSRLAQYVSMKASAYRLLAIDVDEFFFVAESIGSSAIDKALRQFSARIQPVLRSGDLCGRYSGNTFLVIVDSNARDVLSALCDRLVTAGSFRLELSSVSIDLVPRVRVIDTTEEIAGRQMQVSEQALQHGAYRAIPHQEISRHAVMLTGPADVTLPGRITDRRREQRLRVLKQGQIVIADLATINCTVRNLSTGGAGLRLDAPFAAPLRFQLKISGADGSRSAAVRWQTGKDLGVEFLD